LAEICGFFNDKHVNNQLQAFAFSLCFLLLTRYVPINVAKEEYKRSV